MIPNPFDIIGSQAGRIVTDGWIAMWLSVWNGGQWLLRLILGWMDAWLTPDLSASGPARTIYPATFWLAGAVLLVMAVVQIGIAAGRRDGRGMARSLIGVAQFAIIWGGWIGYSVAIVTAAGGLTHAAMESLMGVTSWKSWQPWKPFDPAEIADAGVATVLGLMGLLLWIAAIGHLLVILTRDAALMVIVATTPIAAAGLANETTRAWFWKAFRWFHAAAFTPLLVVLVTGVGMKMAEGVATDGATTSVQGSIGTAVPAIVLICIAVVCPVALFKMLAFVDPGTSSGAAMRAGLTASGGIGGLLAGRTSDASNDSASKASSQGRSAGEDSADAATTTRASSAIQGAMAVLGPAGKAMAAGLGALTTVGAYATTVTSDLANQEGVGNNSYYPDYTDRSRRDATRANREQQGRSGDNNDTTEPDRPPTPPPPAPPSGGPAPAPASGLSASGGSSGAAAAGSSDAAVAAAAI